MEISSKLKDRETPSPLSSPKPPTTISINAHNGGRNIPITTRSDPNSPYPTTFVTADSSSFKHVVQMLTSDSSSSSSPSRSPSRSFAAVPPTHLNHHQQPPLMQQQGFKLYERRNRNRNSNNAAFKNMMINAHVQNASSSQHRPEIVSPSLLDFPALTLSPVTPLTDQDPFDKSSPSVSSGGGGGGSSPSVEEERAIAEKGFYLHPSSISTPRDSEPQLLPLFPLSSPRVSDN